MKVTIEFKTQEIKELMANVAQLVQAIKDLRDAFEIEKSEISDLVSDLKARIDEIPEAVEADIPDDLMAEIEDLTDEIKGLVDTGVEDMPEVSGSVQVADAVDNGEPVTLESEGAVEAE